MAAGKSLQGVFNLDENGNPIGSVQDGATYRLLVDAKIGGGSSVSGLNAFLENGGSHDLRVDGSVTPVDFVFNAHATKTYVLERVRFLMSATSIDLDGSNFASGTGLTNGVLFDATVNGGISVTLGTFQHNLEFGTLSAFNPVLGGIDELLIATLIFGGRTLLSPGTADRVRVRIRDNLTVAGLGLNYFVAAIELIDEG